MQESKTTQFPISKNLCNIVARTLIWYWRSDGGRWYCIRQI